MKNYLKEANRTVSNDVSAIKERLNASTEIIHILHGAMGISTEAGELEDALKKHIFYGKPLDIPNIEEEIGDIFWYVALLCNQLDVDFKSLMDKNIEKLKIRYPDKFTEEKALNRNLDAERKILEK